jgi:DNA-directed RNA polymerase specialized sigma24 family protein
MEKHLESFVKNELEQKIQQLAIAAQSCPTRSIEQRRCFNKLLRLLLKSGKIYRPSFNLQIDAEIYEDALQATFVYIIRNIEKYDPERSQFATWFNSFLRWRLSDSYRAHHEQQMKFVPLDAYSSELVAQTSQTFSSSLDEILDYIQRDPDGHLQGTHIRNRPDINLKYLILQRLYEASWHELSKTLGIPMPTLTSFYSRKAVPILREIAEKFIADE